MQRKESEKRVVLAMSGGVDSSVAAGLLQEEGYEVLGVSMELYSCDSILAEGCCTPKDRLDARRVCENFKIPFEIIDLRVPFRKQVMEYFASEYSKGRTPLPCAPCNSLVRFKALLDYADSVDARWIATGHYARVVRDAEGNASLLRALDPKKDQSYFLWGLVQSVLQRLLFPIGNLKKGEVRAMAKKWNLPTSEKEESQDLCFVGDEDHSRFLETHFPEAAFGAGDFLDSSGAKLGRHQGVHAYTVGQRRGLGVSAAERLYVTRLDAAKNEVVLGPRLGLQASGLMAKDLHWIVQPSAVSRQLSAKLVVKIRSRHAGVASTVEECESGLKVSFETPQEAVTPGQAAVFYNGDICLGGGWIERAL